MEGLSTKELAELIEVLHMFERVTEKDTAVHSISGGFAETDVFNIDDEYIDIELRWGIQSDAENTVHTEQWKLSRETLADEKLSVAEKVRHIEN